mmetsp:Transcript_46174/g.117907  ORF Transcript_46174/g.117907 Transcript_46174/m.117907 type:complete len:133 (+) Transcript_46174:651-1049(+)
MSMAAAFAVSNIRRILRLLHATLPETHIIVAGILPRADGRETETKGVDSPGFFRQPTKYTTATNLANAQLDELTQKWAWASFLDCGPRFLVEGGAGINATLMVDRVHQSPAGYEELAACFTPAICSQMPCSE